MKRKAYGRDRGLSLRMLLTSGLLGLLYVVFAVVLFQVLNVGLVADAPDRDRPRVLPVLHLRQARARRLGREGRLPRAGARAARHGRAALRDGRPAEAAHRRDRHPVPNAFATGRNPQHAAVAVTTGLWRRLDRREVEGVLAHELSHIANRDVAVMTLASFFAMLAAMLTRFGMYGGMFGGGGGGARNNNGPPVWLIVMVVSMPTYVLSFILIRTLSRYREYAADRGAALITGAPEYLMSALQKISSQMTLIPQRDLREVEGMNAFFIIPASVKTSFGALHHAPAAREAARPARRDRPRDGPPGRVAWASSTSSSAARS